jgi:alpha-L-arabinofuranosidase
MMRRNIHRCAIRLATSLPLALFFACLSVQAADVQISVDAGHPTHLISPRLYGVFFEDINFAGDGGLNAELVKNGSFEFPDGMMGWSEERTDRLNGSLQVFDQDPASLANLHYLRITRYKAAGDYGAANRGFRGIGVRAGERYLFSVRARSGDSEPTGLNVALVSSDGSKLASVEVPTIGATWSEQTAILQPSRTDGQTRLVLTLTAPGTVDVDMASLCPEATWKNRPHGLRGDLVQKLADLKPSFLRFPGGCIVEGSELKYRYQWKTTVGDLADRHLIINRWNYEFKHRLTPDYFQSFALGFFEFFQLAEDIGAQPLPILNCGMACQFNSGQLVPLDELDPYLQDALDLIEFANGPVTSTWGAKRAALGHPEPFGMKLLGVGNEQWGPQYFERYKVFAKTLKEKHPEIELVTGAGPFPSGDRFEFAWKQLRPLKADIVDEHCYAMPDWFLHSATRYDEYDRQGPKIFMGEYAAQSVDICSPDNRNNLRCALAEAAFMTGLERNSDVVSMSSYAPLFGHEEAWQWRPNLIWFDSLKSYATPNYYVQQLFSQNRGDVVLPVDIQDTRPAYPPSGRVGVGTLEANAEFKDIQVLSGGDNRCDAESIMSDKRSTSFRGNWELKSGVLRQTDAKATGRHLFGDYGWRDYTLVLKTRRLSDTGGLAIIVRNSAGGSYLQWNLGAGDNKQFALQANLASHSEEKNIVATAPGSIDSDRWYEIKIELSGSRVRCYLDGALVHDVDVRPPELARLFVAASRDDSAKQVVLKVVNPTDSEAEVDLKLDGAGELSKTGHVRLLHGEATDENSLADPDRIAPHDETFNLTGPSFGYKFLPQSLTVMRLDIQ